MTITVEERDDWLKIAALGGPVVDPMIVRCGELFLRGASGARDPGAAWDLITRNIHALGTFFDRLVLDEQIPIFNYADSFDIGQNFDQRALSQVNAKSEILVDVDVRYSAYQEVKSAALEELKKLYSGGNTSLTPQQAYDVLGELTTSGYAWYPQLGDLSLPNESERRLAAYILGGLVFGAYAQQAGTDHLMQPKRSRLFLAIALKGETSRTAEEHLFARLGQLVGTATAEVPYTPTFFSLLLATSTGPADLVGKALVLRESGEVSDYRAWLREALADFDINGRISTARATEVQKIADSVRRRLVGLPIPQVEIKMTVADAIGGKPPGMGVNLTAPAMATWGWFVEQLPGKRHRKLLARAIVADHEYVELNRRVQTVWSGIGLPG
jgi:hypothetical protein